MIPEQLKDIDGTGGWKAKVLYLTGHQAIIRLTRGGDVVSMQVSVSDILEFFVKEKVRRERRSVKGEDVGYGKDWTLEITQKLGLPAYHSREWLENGVKEFGGLAGLSKSSGYSEGTLNGAWLRHGLPPFKVRISDSQRLEIRSARANGEPLKSLAARFRISLGSIHSICKNVVNDSLS